MVLVLSTGALPEGHADLATAVLQDPAVQQANAAFLARSGDDPVPATRRAVCTLMGEEALVDFSSGEWHIGSMDATTCLIVAAACRVTRKAWWVVAAGSLRARACRASAQLAAPMASAQCALQCG